ncbi:MAG: glucokinase [Nevskiales bacterium]
MTKLLVADIGGTNARFAVIDCADSRQPGSCEEVRNFSCAEFTDFEALLDAYLAGLSHRPRYASLGVAGPVAKGICRLTNAGLTVDAGKLARRFDFSEVTLINDLAAVAAAVVHLSPHERTTLQRGDAAATGPISVVGVGTGFGAALLVRDEATWTVAATEAGHQSFSPVDELEIEILRLLSREHGHVSVEFLLSGPGISRLHVALSRIYGEPVEDISPEEICSGARAEVARCARTLSLFFSMLGGVSGDIALTHGATGGLYLGSGIVVPNTSALLQSQFVRRFSAKGPMSSYMQNIPIHIFVSDQAALKGAANWFVKTRLGKKDATINAPGVGNQHACSGTK